MDKLNDYSFAELFEVERTVSLKAIDLPTVMEEVKLPKIDWFKTDSQGTDMRLFQSIGQERINRVLAAEFEPGLMDAYKGEDKLHALLAYMDKNNFWLSNMIVKGSRRIKRSTKNKKFTNFPEKVIQAMIKTAPGWAEVVYLNTLRDEQLFEKRDYLLSWIFATIQKQHGFALDVALKGNEKFNDTVFKRMEKFSTNRILLGLFNLPFFTIKILIEKITR
jgi:hypothetical protein